MISPWRNRPLIDLAQVMTERYLLPRDSGSGFIGEGEKYFSIIDDTEVEIIKALWEVADYLRIPPARRVWGCKWFDHKYFWELANETAKAFELLCTYSNQSDRLYIHRLDRGVMLLLAAQIKHWQRIRVNVAWKTALDCVLYFIKAMPHHSLEYIENVLEVGGYDGAPDVDEIALFSDGRHPNSEANNGFLYSICYKGVL